MNDHAMPHPLAREPPTKFSPNIQRPTEPLVSLQKTPCSQASPTCTSLSNWVGFHGKLEDLMGMLFTVTDKLCIKDNPFVKDYFTLHI